MHDAPSGEVRLSFALFSVTPELATFAKGQNKQVVAPSRPLHGPCTTQGRQGGLGVWPPPQLHSTAACTPWHAEHRVRGRLAMGRRLGKHVVTGQMGTCLLEGVGLYFINNEEGRKEAWVP